MATTFDIHFTGRFQEGRDRQSVLRQFASRFRVSEQQADAMLPADGPSVLKRGVDRATAEAYCRTLAEVGVIAEMVPAGAAPVVGNGAPVPLPDGEGRHFNPYARAVAKRQPDQQSEESEARILSQRVFEGSVAVPASRGISWITEGYGDHVRKDLGAWVGAVMLYFVGSIVVSMVPVVGSLAMMLVSPVIIAGFMIGAREQDQGGSFSFEHLLRGFEAPGQLILLAVFYAIALLLVGLVVFTLFGASILSAVDLESGMLPNPLLVLLPMLLVMLLLLPLLMAYWFAPALVALEGLSALEALKESFIGCLKNILPMLVYGLLGMVLAMVAAIPLLLGFVFLVPVMFASIYVGYRDIFRGGGHAAP